MNYQRVKPAKLSDVIVEQLERMILEGSLPPGERLPAERELAKQFDVSRPSLREAIQKLEAKGLVVRRQGGGTFVQHKLRDGLTDPLFELLAKHDESQLDLLEFRHAVEGISAYYAALRGTEGDLEKIQLCYTRVELAQEQGDSAAEAKAVVALYEVIAEASHNLVLFHLIRGLAPLLEANVLSNFELLYRRPSVTSKIRQHRSTMLKAILDGQPDQAREASHQHLAFIEETLLEIEREESRVERSNRRLRQLKI
ncbi:pyruvate dehydrogenase complex transcriptional repressor PdhR [Aliagarivorans marinus]|uniref:pyruvate dehydrogenase complex transcriptional repressor PdhR n=1 Tax=Aliagarivorans marinus TaxID=561965 RepID=UPI000411494A|nr:pyruvate dehydrogenase complex transcriptional repressor PdhR [Aliagarivorans marinus]